MHLLVLHPLRKQFKYLREENIPAFATNTPDLLTSVGKYSKSYKHTYVITLSCYRTSIYRISLEYARFGISEVFPVNHIQTKDKMYR